MSDEQMIVQPEQRVRYSQLDTLRVWGERALRSYGEEWERLRGEGSMADTLISVLDEVERGRVYRDELHKVIKVQEEALRRQERELAEGVTVLDEPPEYDVNGEEPERSAYADSDPVDCPVCGSPLPHGPALHTHLMTQHPMSMREETKLLRCPECGKAFFYESYMHVHRAWAHIFSAQYMPGEARCPICGEAYEHALSMYVHLRGNHPDTQESERGIHMEPGQSKRDELASTVRLLHRVLSIAESLRSSEPRLQSINLPTLHTQLDAMGNELLVMRRREADRKEEKERVLRASGGREARR